MADEQVDRAKPWTIKSIPHEARNAAIAAAEREKQTLGEWMARAILAQVKAGREQSRAPVLVSQPAQLAASSVDLGEVERIVAMTAQLSAAGAPPPKSVTRAAFGLMRARLKQLRDGQTSAADSPTETLPSPTSEAPT